MAWWMVERGQTTCSVLIQMLSASSDMSGCSSYLLMHDQNTPKLSGMKTISYDRGFCGSRIQTKHSRDGSSLFLDVQSLSQDNSKGCCLAGYLFLHMTSPCGQLGLPHSLAFSGSGTSYMAAQDSKRPRLKLPVLLKSSPRSHLP